MEYQIVSELSATALGKRVNRMIAEGWRPLGGVAVGVGPQGLFQYAQALVKEVAGSR